MGVRSVFSEGEVRRYSVRVRGVLVRFPVHLVHPQVKEYPPPLVKSTVAHLMRSPCWYEHCIPNTLGNGPTLYSILQLKPLPQLGR